MLICGVQAPAAKPAAKPAAVKPKPAAKPAAVKPKSTLKPRPAPPREEVKTTTKTVGKTVIKTTVTTVSTPVTRIAASDILVVRSLTLTAKSKRSHNHLCGPVYISSPSSSACTRSSRVHLPALFPLPLIFYLDPLLQKSHSAALPHMISLRLEKRESVQFESQVSKPRSHFVDLRKLTLRQRSRARRSTESAQERKIVPQIRMVDA